MSDGDLDDLETMTGRVLDGRYVLEKFLDRGGYGAVYQGIDKKFNQPVAIKIGFSSREFMKEARLAAEVKHNHIVQVSDFGSDGGLAYLVMEYLHGEDLEKLFKKQGSRLSPEQLRKLVNEVGDALAYAHADQLIHRDLKPRNIILREHVSKSGTSTGHSKFVLLDFGIAAKLDSEGTQRNRTQDGAGTIEYMAPELLGKQPKATPQSDIYAFGVILYQMMVGRVPFLQSDMSHMALAECLNDICNSPPPGFRDVAIDRVFPPGVEDLVMQCLEKDASRRPASMAEVRQRFLEIYDHALVPHVTRRPRRDPTRTFRPDELGESEEDDAATFASQTKESQRRRTTNPEGAVARDWQQSRGSGAFSQGVRPQSRTNILPWFFLLCALVAGGYWIWNPRPAVISDAPYESLTDDRGHEIQEGTLLAMHAGKSLTLTYAVNDIPKDATVEFDEPKVPEVFKVELANGPIPRTSRNLIISVPDLNSQVSDAVSVSLVARVANKITFQRTIRLTIDSPKPWLPVELEQLGFKEASDSRRCQVGDSVYASILVRKIGGNAIRFRLVPATRVGDRMLNTFYVMEHLVTNDIFHEFARQNPGFEIEQRSDAERAWENEPLAQAPVTNIAAVEALTCAWWIASKEYASLPSTTEWELAAGYWDFIRALEMKYGSLQKVTAETLRNFHSIQTIIPNLGVTAWLGTGPESSDFQEPGGVLLKMRSPYGCEYNHLADGRRPREVTRTMFDDFDNPGDLRVMCRSGIPPLADSSLNVYLRGADEKGNEITWVKRSQERVVKTINDLTNDATILRLSPDNNSIYRGTNTGFRVVILTQIDGN